jgi:NAD+ synthase (glutamine-hydrolysing)
MALSNKFSALVLTTGNKSEMAVGYCTLYGDMVGALAVIGDLVKTRVYAVCRWLNRSGEVIPARHSGKAALGRTAPGPEGHRLAAALRGSRPDSRSLCGAL